MLNPFDIILNDESTLSYDIHLFCHNSSLLIFFSKISTDKKIHIDKLLTVPIYYKAEILLPYALIFSLKIKITFNKTLMFHVLIYLC